MSGTRGGRGRSSRPRLAGGRRPHPHRTAPPGGARCPARTTPVRTDLPSSAEAAMQELAELEETVDQTLERVDLLNAELEMLEARRTRLEAYLNEHEGR